MSHMHLDNGSFGPFCGAPGETIAAIASHWSRVTCSACREAIKRIAYSDIRQGRTELGIIGHSIEAMGAQREQLRRELHECRQELAAAKTFGRAEMLRAEAHARALQLYRGAFDRLGWDRPAGDERGPSIKLGED